MAYQIGFVDDSVKLASHAFLDALFTLATTNGWVALRDARTGDNPELILRGPGNLDYQDVYVGFRCYHDVAADFYNIEVAGFTGYDAGADFANQPAPLDGSGQRFSTGVPLHNLRVDYWLCVNALRITFGAKVGTPVYVACYAGLYLHYGDSGQNPYPLAIGGCFDGPQELRFSTTPSDDEFEASGYYDMPYRSNVGNFMVRTPNNQWLQAEVWPWNNTYFTTTTIMRDDGSGYYPLFPAVVNDSALGVMGELDGVYYIPGFGNSAENTLVVGGVNYVVMQAISQTGFNDYYAMRLD